MYLSALRASRSGQTPNVIAAVRAPAGVPTNLKAAQPGQGKAGNHVRSSESLNGPREPASTASPRKDLPRGKAPVAASTAAPLPVRRPGWHADPPIGLQDPVPNVRQHEPNTSDHQRDRQASFRTRSWPRHSLRTHGHLSSLRPRVTVSAASGRYESHVVGFHPPVRTRHRVPRLGVAKPCSSEPSTARHEPTPRPHAGRWAPGRRVIDPAAAAAAPGQGRRGSSPASPRPSRRRTCRRTCGPPRRPRRFPSPRSRR